jgi:hypothetical protein
MGTETFGGIGSGSADFTLSINYLGAMTPIQKWYANGDIAMGYGLGRVFWDESTIRLGIRTTLPTRTLDVAGPDGIHIAQGTPTTPALGDIYVATGSGILTWHDGTAARRTVHAPIALTDNALIRGDGGTTGIQTSGILVSDTDAITGFTLLGIEDTDGTHNLSLKWNENSAANRTLNLLGLTGADRSLTFTADASLGGTNTGDVTLSGTPDYITISGQVITRGAIDLATDITGDLPYANLTPSGSASKLLGRGDSGAGDWQEITLGTGFSISGTTLNFSGGAATVDVDPAGALDGDGSGGDPLAVRVDGVTVIINGSNELEATGTGGAHADTHYEGEADEVDITQLGGYSTVATEFLDGTGDFDTVKDSDLSTSDITTNDVTTSKHGFTPKAPNDSTKFLRGDATWAVPSGGGWALAGTCNSTGTTSTGSWTYSSNVTTVDFIDLSGYKEVLIIVSGVTKDQSRSFCVAVSTNNGSSFLSSSGDYITIDASGVPTNQVNIPNIHNTNATAARYCQVMIHNFSSTDAHSKLWTPMTTQGLGSVGRIPTTSALNAVRVLLSGAGNMTGGDIRIYAR